VEQQIPRKVGALNSIMTGRRQKPPAGARSHGSRRRCCGYGQAPGGFSGCGHRLFRIRLPDMAPEHLKVAKRDWLRAFRRVTIRHRKITRPRCSERAEELHCCDRTALGEKTEKCRLQKRTCWLPRLSIDGRISGRAFPQKSASTPFSSFEPLVGSNTLRRIDEV
jgi:hypothetical protein